MSKERQRRRAEQEAARAKPKPKKAPAERPSAVTTAKRSAAKKQPVYRQRRFPRLPWRLKLALALFWLTAVVLIVLTVPTWTGRIGLVVVATMALPLIVVIVRDPSRRTRR